MAMQIMFASISGNNIKYPEESHCINVTANLKPICDEFFEEKTFLEDGEEIIIQVVRHEKVKEFSERIEKNVSETKYSCSIGYSYNADGSKTIEQMVKESDEMMYQNKAKYYQNKGIDRRGNKYEK